MTTTQIPLRRDARRNREAILAAAKELFAESGEVPMCEIARRAGVGQATLYRHFPDREAVAAALAAEQLDRLERLAASRAGDPDAFFVVLRGIVDGQARCHGGLHDILRESPNARSGLDGFNQRLVELLRHPIRDAKAAGTLRPDLTVDDVVLVMAMVHGALDAIADPSGRAAAAGRALALTIDGLTTRGGAGG
ncbi:MAG: TetR/AcrR family transcriptional regulator [Frankia sp.]